MSSAKFESPEVITAFNLLEREQGLQVNAGSNLRTDRPVLEQGKLNGNSGSVFTEKPHPIPARKR
jgi:hypothetical protein